jgi:Salmonella virulence plasmid 65kDa B protein
MRENLDVRDNGRSQHRATSDNNTTGPSGANQAPSIILPKGGGAIRGIGEKFAANPVTGTGSMTVPIATSPGRSGFGPQLSLSYDSGGGNGPFGLGWSLSLPSITRKTDKGLPTYQDADESDVFILSGAEDLVPVLIERDGTWEREQIPPRTINGHTYHIQRYRPRIEGLFARIERWTNVTTGESHWRSITRDNITTLYGKDNDSRIFDPADPDPTHPTRIFSWLICQSYDDKGNAIMYDYQHEDSQRIFEDQQGQFVALAHERNRDDASRSANRYLKRIKYGNRIPNRDAANWQATDPAQLPHDTWMFKVVFDYDERHVFNETTNNNEQMFIEASAVSTKAWTRRDDPFSSYRAGFEVRTYRLCRRVLMFHHFPQELGIDDCLVRSTDFAYSHEQEPTSARNPVYTFLLAVTQSGYKRDNNGYLKRSLPPVEFAYSQPMVQDSVQEVDTDSLENLPIGLDGAAYQWTDLHGEGLPGLLTEQGAAWFYKRNLSPRDVKYVNGVAHTEAKFAPVELVAKKPNLTLASGQAQFMDLAGDGQPDLVVLDGPPPRSLRTRRR